MNYFASMLQSEGARGLLDSISGGAARSPMDAMSDDQRSAHIVDSAARSVRCELAATGAAMVQTWAATDSADLGEDESMGDRLVSLLAGLEDGEEGDDDQDVAEMIGDAAADYMSELGVSDADIEAIFGDDEEAANAAADRALDRIIEALPDGEEEAMDSVNDFAFGARALPALDAVYRKKVVVRNGRRAIIRKRVSGIIRRTAKQKMALKKALRKAHGAAAKMHRAKSMRVRRARGL